MSPDGTMKKEDTLALNKDFPEDKLDQIINTCNDKLGKFCLFYTTNI